jgi:hypothetical protein
MSNAIAHSRPAKKPLDSGYQGKLGLYLTSIVIGRLPPCQR